MVAESVLLEYDNFCGYQKVECSTSRPSCCVRVCLRTLAPLMLQIEQFQLSMTTVNC